VSSSAHRERRKKPTTKDLLPPLALFGLGIIGSILLFVLGDGFKFLDVGLLLAVVGFVTFGYTQRFLRGVASVVFLYVATLVAATFYNVVAPFVGAPFGEKITNGIRALSFVVLTAIVWVALAAVSRVLFKDLSLPKIGVLDNLGGVVLYLLVGILVVTLVFNAMGYQQRKHPRARLRPALRSVLRIHYLSQSFWFPKGQPMFYLYDLDLSGES